jgi:hypothetical protein
VALERYRKDPFDQMRRQQKRKVRMWQWPGLIARYAWRRSPPLCLVAILGVGYTAALAVVGGAALDLWLAGLGVTLLGSGPILGSRRPTDDIARRQMVARTSIRSPLDLAWGRLPMRAARKSQTAAGIGLVILGFVLAGWSVVALVR